MDDSGIAYAGQCLETAAAALADSTEWLLARAAEDQEDVLAGAAPYLRQFGNVAGGYYLLRGVLSAAAAGVRQSELDAHQQVLSFYVDNTLAESEALSRAVKAGKAAVRRLDPELLTA